MADYVTNSVGIEAKKLDLKKLKSELFTNEDFDFNKLIESTSNHFEAWGTNTNALRTEVVNEETTFLLIQFETPWCPPVEVFKALKGKYPEYKVTWEFTPDAGGKTYALDFDEMRLIVEEVVM